MANTKLKVVAPMVAIESLSSKFAASATLATASFTVPTNISGVWCYPSAACHWHPNGTATTSFMHAVAAKEPFYIESRFVSTAQIIGDAGAITLAVVYMRGARAGIAVSGDVTRPY